MVGSSPHSNGAGGTMTSNLKSDITLARFPQDRDAVSALFTAYAKSLGIDLTFQNFEHELASLPGKYLPENGGALFIARLASSARLSPFEPSERSAETIGCVALRAFRSPDVCELKRLYVTPASRGLGAGQDLLAKAIETARELGYKQMLLDTLPSMAAARKMYKAAGFLEVEAYYEIPIADTSFMCLKLS